MTNLWAVAGNIAELLAVVHDHASRLKVPLTFMKNCLVARRDQCQPYSTRTYGALEGRTFTVRQSLNELKKREFTLGDDIELGWIGERRGSLGKSVVELLGKELDASGGIRLLVCNGKAQKKDLQTLLGGHVNNVDAPMLIHMCLVGSAECDSDRDGSLHVDIVDFYRAGTQRMQE